MVDGTIVPAAPGEVLRRGEAAKVPMIIGTTSQDIAARFPPSPDDPLSYFGADAGKARAAYDPEGTLEPSAVLWAVGVDMTMQEPARFVAKQMTAAGSPVWLYRFSYVADSMRAQWHGAPHASELPYVFGTLDTRYGEKVTDRDWAAAHALATYFANFARDGDPNGSGLPPWPRFDPARAELMDFTPNNGPVYGPDPWKERLDLVERAAEALEPALPAEIVDVTWAWVSFTTPAGQVIVDAPERYTLQLARDGRAALRADCNRGATTYSVGSGRRIALNSIALTRAMCPPGSLSDRYVKEIGRASTYFLKDGDLFLELPVDSGTMRFRRQGS